VPLRPAATTAVLTAATATAATADADGLGLEEN